MAWVRGGGMPSGPPPIPPREGAAPVSAAPSKEADEWLARLRRGVSLRVTARGIAEIRMLREAGGKPLAAEGGDNPALARRARAQVAEYLGGRRTSFDLPLDLSGLTPFMRDALCAAARIPYGETRSYAWVAREAGRPRAFRAVGQAMHRNPIPLVVP